MECKELLAQLGEYIDGELDDCLCEALEEHLDGCDPCRVVVDNLRGTVQIYKNCEPYQVPIEFQKHLSELLRKRWKECHSDEE